LRVFLFSREAEIGLNIEGIFVFLFTLVFLLLESENDMTGCTDCGGGVITFSIFLVRRDNFVEGSLVRGTLRAPGVVKVKECEDVASEGDIHLKLLCLFSWFL